MLSLIEENYKNRGKSFITIKEELSKFADKDVIDIIYDQHKKIEDIDKLILNKSQNLEYELDNFITEHCAKKKLGKERELTENVNFVKDLVVKNENKLLSKVSYEDLNREFPKKEGMKQIFLSYAYEDKLMALKLFFDFYKYGIYLYVDFMHNGKLITPTIKAKLKNEILNSDQLLFLRTKASEFYHVSPKKNKRFSITSFCAWEIGVFYTRKPNEKYYYSKVPVPKNYFLSTLREFNHIDTINHCITDKL